MDLQQLIEEIQEKTGGKLTKEQIKQVVDQSRIEDEDLKVSVTSNPYEYGEDSVQKQEFDNNYSLEETVEGIIGDTKAGEYEDRYQGDLIDEPANFSLNELQVSIKRSEEYIDGEYVDTTTINIYMPEKEYDVKTYKELIERDKLNQLVEEIQEKTKGRLTEEQIQQIVNQSGLEQVAVLVTSDPHEYGVANVENKKFKNNYSLEEQVEGIIGDTKAGEYEDRYQGDLIDEPADFSLNELQVSIKRSEEYADGRNDDTTIINIYMPEKEYDVKTYKKLIERDKLNQLVEEIEEKTKGRLTEEQIQQIVNQSGLEQVAVLVTSDPHEYGMANVENKKFKNNYSLEEQVEGIIGDTKAGEYEDRYQGDLIDEPADFSLNELQVSIKRSEEYADGRNDDTTTINIYMPEKEYDVKTYKELIQREMEEQGLHTVEEVKEALEQTMDKDMLTNTLEGLQEEERKREDTKEH